MSSIEIDRICSCPKKGDCPNPEDCPLRDIQIVLRRSRVRDLEKVIWVTLRCTQGTDRFYVVDYDLLDHAIGCCSGMLYLALMRLKKIGYLQFSDDSMDKVDMMKISISTFGCKLILPDEDWEASEIRRIKKEKEAAASAPLPPLPGRNIWNDLM